MFHKFICKLTHEFEMCFPMGIKVNVLARLVHKGLFNLEVAGNILKTHIFHEIMIKKKSTTVIRESSIIQ